MSQTDVFAPKTALPSKSKQSFCPGSRCFEKKNSNFLEIVYAEYCNQIGRLKKLVPDGFVLNFSANLMGLLLGYEMISIREAILGIKMT
jgi:hypothetical protein